MIIMMIVIIKTIAKIMAALKTILIFVGVGDDGGGVGWGGGGGNIDNLEIGNDAGDGLQGQSIKKRDWL